MDSYHIYKHIWWLPQASQLSLYVRVTLLPSMTNGACTYCFIGQHANQIGRIYFGVEVRLSVYLSFVVNGY